MVRVGQYIGGWLAKGLYREQGSARKREGEREGEQETAQEAEGEIDEDGGEGRKEGEKVCIKEREREREGCTIEGEWRKHLPAAR